MNNFLYKALNVIDYSIIILKIVVFLDIFRLYEILETLPSKQVYSIFLLPAGIYFGINFTRLFFRRRESILMVELVVNLIFTFLTKIPHEFIFLILTATSIIIVSCVGRFKILTKYNEHKMNE